MNYDRLTLPGVTPVRCKETNYTQQEELEAVRQRLYELETAIEDGLLIQVPSSRQCYISTEDGQSLECYQHLFYNDNGCLEVQYSFEEDVNALQ